MPKPSKHKADTSEVLPRVKARLNGGEERVNFTKGGKGDLPPDLPIELEVSRVMNHERQGMSFTGALLGHELTLTVDGKTVVLKTYRPSTTGYDGMKIEVNGDEVYSSVKKKGKK